MFVFGLSLADPTFAREARTGTQSSTPKIAGAVEKCMSLGHDALAASPLAQIVELSLPKSAGSTSVLYQGARAMASIIAPGLNDISQMLPKASATNGYVAWFLWVGPSSVPLCEGVLERCEREGKALGDDESRIAPTAIGDTRSCARRVERLQADGVRKIVR